VSQYVNTGGEESQSRGLASDRQFAPTVIIT